MNITIETIAEICHEANAIYCRAIGDNSQPFWHVAPSWQQESAMKGVRLHLKNPGLDASASHKARVLEKLATGWKFGPVKNELKKEHPCIVPFDHLPLHQQVKDALFSSIVHALLPVVKEEDD